MIVSTLKDYGGGLNGRKHDRNLHIVSVNIINIIWFSCEIHGLILAGVLLKFTVIKRKAAFWGTYDYRDFSQSLLLGLVHWGINLYRARGRCRTRQWGGL